MSIKRVSFSDGYTSEVAPSTDVLYSGPSVVKAIANNVSTAVDLVGLVFSPDDYKGFVIDYVIKRKTDSALSELSEIGQITGNYNTRLSTWNYSYQSTGDYSGVELSVTSLGQFQYVSSNISGDNYEGELSYVISRAF